MHMFNSFVTLTYDDDHLPEYNSLNYKHFQDFMKRLRKSHNGVRFYMCGEYGPIVDKAAVSTDSFVKYTIYSLKDGIVPPFLRVRDVEVLDSSNQATGFKVPYGDFVDIRSKCDFETVNPEETVLDKRLFFIPGAPFPKIGRASCRERV